MTHEILLGDRAYSSWSMRAALLIDRFDLPVRSRFVRFDTRDVAAQLAPHAPARTVPTLLCDDGAVVWDSLALAEELASRFPAAGLWPAEPRARATARSLAAEMHSGFAALRTHCPMNLRVAYADCAPPPEVLDDLRRIETIWDAARAATAPAGPWLCGDYSIADAAFAPVAARIAGYGLKVSASAAAYVAAHLADPAFRRWRALALHEGPDLPWYARDYPQVPWPGPAPRPASRADGPSVNAACPYSGGPVTHFLAYEGRTWGFCNALCRDRTLADPEVWPAFQRMVAASR